MAAVALVTMAAVVVSLRFLTRPLQALTVAMDGLRPRPSVPIAATERQDEIGEMARAVDVFRQNMIRSDQLATEQAAARAARSRRQDAMERDTEAFGVTVAAVMTKLSGSTEVMRDAAEAMTQASATVHQAATRTSDDAGKSSQDLAFDRHRGCGTHLQLCRDRQAGGDCRRRVAPGRAARRGEPGHHPQPGGIRRPVSARWSR